MDASTARQVLGERFDEDAFHQSQRRVRDNERSTFVQLLKNRPGTHTETKGIEMLSPNESLRMIEKGAEVEHHSMVAPH